MNPVLEWKSTLIVVALVVSIGLVTGSMGHSQGVNAITGAEAQELVADGALLVDVRTPQEFHASRIDGAVNIPVQELENRLDEFGAREGQIVVFCRSGNRSHQATIILENAGFEHVYDLGSYRNWPTE